MIQYDVAVIGSGAGLVVLEAALRAGKLCALIEKDKLGGTCLTRGCIPSKMLVYPADVIRAAQAARNIGLNFDIPAVDWQLITQRMKNQIDFSRRIEENLSAADNLHIYRATAEFVDNNNLLITQKDGREIKIRAEKVIVAAGGRTRVPPIKGLEEAGYVTSETFFDRSFPDRPWQKLVILGGGAVGAEFAHIFSSFNTEVSIVERGWSVLSAEEEEIGNFVTRQFRKNGIRVLSNSAVVNVKMAGGQKQLLIESIGDGSSQIVSCDEIFVATGIRSNSDKIKAQNAGIKLDERGWIVTDDTLATSQPNIWAIGDINGKFQFRHKANYEAEILSNNLFPETPDQPQKRADYSAVPWAVFTHPQTARVGMTLGQAKAGGIRCRVGTKHYSQIAGGIAMGFGRGDDDGFVKIIVGEDKKILGVHIVGPHAAILLQPFVYLMNAGHRCSTAKGPSRHKMRNFEGIELMCPSFGTYVPVSDSMVIHPSLNELTAWVIESIDWHNDNPE
jgi:mycothione reductase